MCRKDMAKILLLAYIKAALTADLAAQAPTTKTQKEIPINVI
jgi:hypothetical protein